MTSYDLAARPATAAPAARPARVRAALPALLVAVAALVAAVAGWSLPALPSAGALPAVGPAVAPPAAPAAASAPALLPGPAPPPSPPAPAAGSGDWAATLASLDAARAEAFARADPSRLGAVYVRGSPPHRADLALLDRHARTGLRVAGLRLVVVSARPHAVSAGTVELDVVDRLAPYAVVDRVGRVVRRWPGRGDARWRVSLRRTPAGWRIAAVTAATRGAGGGP